MNDKILVVNGPNLHLLGQREPDQYGSESEQELKKNLARWSEETGVGVDYYQSNREGELIEYLSEHLQNYAFLVLNPAALTHTSVALRDCVKALDIPFIEVHISNIYRREVWRQKSFFSDIALGMISGCGLLGYELALTFGLNKILKGKARC